MIGDLCMGNASGNLAKENGLICSIPLNGVIAITTFLAAVILFFGKYIFFVKPIYGSDFILQFYPWKHFLYEYVRSEGTLPFWNPYVLSGTPFVANIQASMFYPLGFLYYILPSETAYLYSTVLHCTLGGVFMYRFMGRLSVARWGALLAAFIFSFNGYFLAHLYAGHLAFVQNYIWIPAIFLFLHQFLNTGRFY
jgi:hypothetical protein